MKRAAFSAAALAAVFVLSLGARPVLADDPAAAAEDSGLVHMVDRAVAQTVNPIAERVPTPPGWNDRHVCLVSTQVNHYWCVFFPFPI